MSLPNILNIDKTPSKNDFISFFLLGHRDSNSERLCIRQLFSPFKLRPKIYFSFVLNAYKAKYNQKYYVRLDGLEPSTLRLTLVIFTLKIFCGNDRLRTCTNSIDFKIVKIF